VECESVPDPGQPAGASLEGGEEVARGKPNAIGSMRSIQKQPERVKGYFGQKDVCYAAA
jgi:hypothetical protein